MLPDSMDNHDDSVNNNSKTRVIKRTGTLLNMSVGLFLWKDKKKMKNNNYYFQNCYQKYIWKIQKMLLSLYCKKDLK